MLVREQTPAGEVLVRLSVCSMSWQRACLSSTRGRGGRILVAGLGEVHPVAGPPGRLLVALADVGAVGRVLPDARGRQLLNLAQPEPPVLDLELAVPPPPQLLHGQYLAQLDKLGGLRLDRREQRYTVLADHLRVALARLDALRQAVLVYRTSMAIKTLRSRPAA